MPIFEYKGVGVAGKSLKGVVEADSPKTARLKLKAKGVYTTDLKERSSTGGTGEKKGLAKANAKAPIADDVAPSKI